MNKDEIQKMLTEIQDWVAILDDKLKPTAFDYLVNNYNKIKVTPTGEVLSEKKVEEQDLDKQRVSPSFSLSTSLNENIERLSKLAEVDKEDIMFIFDFQEDMPRLLEEPKESTRKQKQIKALLLLGIVLKKIYNQDKFRPLIVLKRSRIPAERLDHLNVNKEFRKYFSGDLIELQLTYQGEKKALELLKEFTNKSNGN
ncbi:MAG: hypothetical protein O8C63_04635 [Candidatus Methanoperedens sp.]|nr:hypothetical protein [Candidatus Methanoperedens sp.]